MTSPASNFEQKAVEMIDKLQDLASQMAPQAWELAVSAVQAQGIANLVVGVLCGLIAVSIGALSYKVVKNTDDLNRCIAATVVGGVPTVGFVIAMFVNLLNADNWIATFAPAAALALKALG